ncbi:30S ribosomal protein S9 [Candidatus Giovannonibacteria bacterium RIFOXYC1_FULL_48_8]|nr:MAG: 30S ribosomal protein S9 [Candidatus Giovannonibacteria bacterium RIFOXYC1_FULL_48_8]
MARVRLYEGEKFSIFINQKPFENYFPTYELRHIVEEPLSKTNLTRDFSISVKVNGGGIHSQAEAVRHGISRMLEKREPGLRKILKPLGFLKRDPRMKERRKFGLKKARKAPQWAKR